MPHVHGVMGKCLGRVGQCRMPMKKSALCEKHADKDAEKKSTVIHLYIDTEELRINAILPVFLQVI